MGRVMRWTAGMMVCAAVMTSAACTDEPTQPTDLSDTTSSTTASETSEAPSGSESSASASSSFSPDEQAVVDQYKGYYNAIYTLTTPTDDEVRAAFTPYAIDSVVDHWIQVFKSFEEDGKNPAGNVEFGPLEVLVSSNDATVSECRNTTTEVFVSTADGKEISHGGPGTKVEAQLTHVPDGKWLIVAANASPNSC